MQQRPNRPRPGVGAPQRSAQSAARPQPQQRRRPMTPREYEMMRRQRQRQNIKYLAMLGAFAVVLIVAVVLILTPRPNRDAPVQTAAVVTAAPQAAATAQPGGVNLDDPSTINLYASSFENKDIIEEVIADYNEGVDELQQITYVDYVGLMMSSITTIINAITYVLIAFVAISLVVSSIMIGVITLISVQERTKEIGVLRAIGASKRNVSSMFNAETVIIGFTSGALGIGITYLLCIPINAIIQHLTGIANLKAILPLEVAAVLIGLSMLLNLISGVIPSRSAAKKDPVVALRSE